MRMMKLPYDIQHRPVNTMQFLGLNLTNNTQEGEFKDTLGLSSADYPYITQIPERIHMDGYNTPSDIYVWDRDLFVVDGTSLKKNGAVIGTVTRGLKQMAVINTKLVIYPDKIYVDLNDDSIHPLVAKKHIYANATVTDHSVTAAGIGSAFASGDVVDLIGTGITGKRIVVQEASGNTITFVDGAISGTLSGSLTVQTSIPDMDFICSSNNRIWGCSNADNTIYVSALGDPTDFFNYGSDSGAYTLAVGSEGDFTGICNYGGAVLVWKEDMLHKMLGSYPSEYYMIDVPIYGVQKGSEKSLVIINNVLYYKGVYGVYQYAGNQPVSISYNLGNHIYTNGVAGTDGRKYYIGMTGPGMEFYLYAYDLAHNLWLKEELGSVGAIANIDRDVYLLWQHVDMPGVALPSGLQKIGERVDPDLLWHSEFVETTENTFHRKGYTKILLRIDMTQGSELRVKAKEDRRAFRTVFEQTSTNDVTFTVPIRLGRCDRYTIRLEGKGKVTILAMGREHVTGSTK